ncbi:hypothetical protein PFISCL1PPCAC_22763, partial [Pristionchus fissidentatus]
EQQRGAGAAAYFHQGAPPHQQAVAYARPQPPPAVQRAEQAGDTGNVHGTPLSAFDHQQSSAAYTASWVSSTSSMPPDLKEVPEDGHVYHQIHAGNRTPIPGNEWVQPGGGGGAAAAAAAVYYGGTWGDRRDESMFAAAHATGGGAAGSTFDHSQFARMNMDYSHQVRDAQSYSSAAPGGGGGGMTGGGEWNQPQQVYLLIDYQFQTNAWQTNNTNLNQSQPLMMLAQPQPMQLQQQQQNKGRHGLDAILPRKREPI